MNLKPPQLGIKWVYIILAVFVLISCARDISESELLGIWVESVNSPSSKDNIGCSTIEFFENGKFEAKSLPQEYFIWLGLPPKIRIDASGKWEMQTESSNDKLRNRIIKLIFDENPGSTRYTDSFTSEIYLTNVGEPMLYADLGTLDDAIIFTQDKTTWCKIKPIE